MHETALKETTVSLYDQRATKDRPMKPSNPLQLLYLHRSLVNSSPTKCANSRCKTIAHTRSFISTSKMDGKFAPAKRVAGQKQDVWSIVNEAAAASPKQPIGKGKDILEHPQR